MEDEISEEEEEEYESESEEKVSQSSEQNDESESIDEIKNENDDMASHNLIDDKVMKQIIDRDEPELTSLLAEFNDSMDIIQNKLKPVLNKV